MGYQFSLVTQLCPTVCDPMDCSIPGFPVLHISQSLLKLMSTELVMPSNHLILCRPLLLLTSIFPSIRVLSNELALRTRWSKYWNVNVSPSNEYSGLISFSIDWFDLLAAQGTLKKTECQRNDAFELWCWRRRLRVPWKTRRSDQSILKEINPEYSLEGLTLKLKNFGHLM